MPDAAAAWAGSESDGMGRKEGQSLRADGKFYNVKPQPGKIKGLQTFCFSLPTPMGWLKSACYI